MGNQEIESSERMQEKAGELLVAPVWSLTEVGQWADKLAAQNTFVRYRERKAPDTIRRHRADLELFATYLRQVPGLRAVGDLYQDPTAWHGMSKGLVEGFVQWQVGAGYAIGSINMRLSTVKLYCRLAQGAGALGEEQASMIRTVMGYRGSEGKRIDALRPVTRIGDKKAKPTMLSISQAKALIEQPDTPQGRRDRVLMCLLLYHGLRCEEIPLLRVSSFDLTTGLFCFEQPKVGGELRHRMHLQTYLAVKRYLEEEHPTEQLLLGSRKNGHVQGTMSKSAINQRVRWLGEQLGIKKLSPHDCRHFWATSASEAGTDLENLKQAGGWSSLEMPSRYIKGREIANEQVKLSH
ncbi:MAG TPA: site-specific integrase [Ktedonobacteraceae bacterium]